MAITSKIEWTDATLNFWLGCEKVSPACRLCYIVRQTPLRVRGMKHGDPRERTNAATWNQARAWNRKAEREGRTMRVFANSLSDWLDDQVPIEWLADMLKVIHDTPHLTWQLLTKRPENWRRRVTAAWGLMDGDYYNFCRMWTQHGEAPKNVHIGTTVENQACANLRHVQLMAIPALVHFWSSEPLLSAIDARDLWAEHGAPDWVIAGGESGARNDDVKPTHPQWVRGMRDQCVAAGVPFFFKQWGDWSPRSLLEINGKPYGGGTDFVRLDPRCEKWPQVIRLGEHGKNTRISENCTEDMGEETFVQRVGKKLAGRLLDGREWDELPGGREGDAEMGGRGDAGTKATP